jgi:hypothetical protein
VILLAFSFANRLFDLVLTKIPYVNVNPQNYVDWYIDLTAFIFLVAIFFWMVSKTNPEAWRAITKMLGVEWTVEDDYYP